MSFVIGPISIIAAGGSSSFSFLYVDLTTVGNIDGGSDDLMSYTVPAGTLAEIGDTLIIYAHGSFGGNGGLRTIKFLVDGTTISSEIGGAEVDNDHWGIESRVTRRDATTLEVFTDAEFDTNTAKVIRATETVSDLDSNSFIIKFQGQDNNSNTDEVQQNYMAVQKIAAP